MKKQIKESRINKANKNDKFLLYRKPSNSPSPGHGEYLYASGNTLDELFDNWIETMKLGGYGYKGSDLERERKSFLKDKLKYWENYPSSFYKLRIKNKSDLDQLNMDRHHRDYLARNDKDDDPRESKQFKLADIAKRILKEEGFDKDGNPYGFKYNDEQYYPKKGDEVEATFIGSNPKYKQFKNKPFIDVVTGVSSPSTEPWCAINFKNHGQIKDYNDWNFVKVS